MIKEQSNGIPVNNSGNILGKWLVRAILILNTGLAFSYIGLFFITAWKGLLWRADFSAFYTGWAIVRDGSGKYLYNIDLQTRYQQTVLEGRSFAGGLLPFSYPPHMALIFSPLAQFPRTTAFWLWTVGECALLAWLLHLLFNFTRSWQPIDRWLTLSTILSFPAMLYNFLLGAFSLFLLICLWQFYLAMQNGHDGQGGIWLAAGLIKPQNILLPGIILVGARRWRALLGAALGGILIFIAASLAFGLHIWVDFMKLLSSLNNQYGSMGMEPTSMYNFKGILTSILGANRGMIINFLSWAALVASILFTFWIWRGIWRDQGPTYDLRMAYTLVLGLFFNLYLFPQDSLLLVLPALLFYHFLRSQNLPRKAYTAFILLLPILFLVSEFVVGNKLIIQIPSLVMAGLLVWMTPWLIKEGRHGSGG